MRQPCPLAAFAALLLLGKVSSKYCDGGQYCPPPKDCCAQGCCAYRPPLPLPPSATSLVFWNHWYFWLLLLLLLASCAGGCGLWRRRQGSCCGQEDDFGNSETGNPTSSRSSVGSCCPPPHYSRCSSMHHAPPPYTEVTSKPDLYPLVISYGDTGKSGIGGSYLMVQYFRNYIVRPVGSLSATSTADSLSSSFLCSTANEMNNSVPPPYSSAGSLDVLTPVSGPAGAADMATAAGGGDIQSLPPGGLVTSATGSDVSSLAGLGTPASPPRATSPTLEIRELLDKIQQLPRESALPLNSPTPRTRQRPHLYTPLAPRPAPKRWLSRSAPTTPSTQLPPDGSPLLAELASDDELDATL